MRLIFQGLFRHIFDRFFAKAKALSVGQLSVEIPKDIAVTDELMVQTVSRKSFSATLVKTGKRKNCIPGITCTYLLARTGRKRKSRTRF